MKTKRPSPTSRSKTSSRSIPEKKSSKANRTASAKTTTKSAVKRAGASQQTKVPNPSILWQWDDSVDSATPSHTSIVTKQQLDAPVLLPSRTILRLDVDMLILNPSQRIEKQTQQSSRKIGLVGASYVDQARALFDQFLVVADTVVEELPPHATFLCRDLRGKKRHLWLKQPVVHGAWELFVPKTLHVAQEMLFKIVAQDKTVGRFIVQGIVHGGGGEGDWVRDAMQYHDRVAGYQTPATWSLAEMEQALALIVATPNLAAKVWMFQVPGIPAWDEATRRFARALAKLPGSSLVFDHDRSAYGTGFMPSGPTALVTLNGLKQLELPLLHRITETHAKDLLRHVESFAQWQSSADGFVAVGTGAHPLLRFGEKQDASKEKVAAEQRK